MNARLNITWEVAAHLAKVLPSKDDNVATLDASVIHHPAFSDDAFYVGAMRITTTVNGVASRSALPRWGLTRVHSALAPRL